MDLSAEVERALEEMEWGEVVTTLTGAVHELLNGTTNPPSPPPTTPAPVSAGLEPNTQDEGYGDFIPVGDGPVPQEDSVHPGHLHCGAGACCQGQYLPYLWPVEDIPTAAGVSHPAAPLPQPAAAFSYPAPLPQPAAAFSYPAPLPQPAAAFSYPAPPPQPVTNGPVVKLAEGQSLRFVGVLNGQPVYEVIAEVAAPPVCAAPPQDISNSKKRKRDSQQDEDRPYIKKPPNAFMLFLKEHRAKVRAEFGRIGSAEVNTILGQVWRSLTKEQQAKYFSQAEKERLLHSQQHPEWSTQDNYDKKRKRQRGKTSRLDSPKTVSTSVTSPLTLTQTQNSPTDTQTRSPPTETHH